jgi:hypothetical protein
MSFTFSKILKLNSCGTTPIHFLAFIEFLSISFQNTFIFQEFFLTKSVSIQIIVVFHAQLYHKRAKKSPFSISKVTDLRTFLDKYDFFKFFICNAFMIFLI